MLNSSDYAKNYASTIGKSLLYIPSEFPPPPPAINFSDIRSDSVGVGPVGMVITELSARVVRYLFSYLIKIWLSI